jgi:hypothetical protein
MFNFTNHNHKEEFAYYTDELIANGDVLSVSERNYFIKEMTESYVQAIGKKPPSRDLEALANYLMYEHLTDRSPDKMTTEEYPVLSERQQRTRRSKEFTKEESTLDYIKLRKSNQNHNLNKRNTSSIQE